MSHHGNAVQAFSLILDSVILDGIPDKAERCKRRAAEHLDCLDQDMIVSVVLALREYRTALVALNLVRAEDQR